MVLSIYNNIKYKYSQCVRNDTNQLSVLDRFYCKTSFCQTEEILKNAELYRFKEHGLNIISKQVT